MEMKLHSAVYTGNGLSWLPESENMLKIVIFSWAVENEKVLEELNENEYKTNFLLIV